MDDQKKYFTYLFFQLRDRQETSQVLFVFPSEKGRGRELRPSENIKLEGKLEENRGRGLKLT